MDKEPIGTIDPIKQIIMKSVSKFATGEIKGWAEFCADLEIGIKEYVDFVRRQEIKISCQCRCRPVKSLAANERR